MITPVSATHALTEKINILQSKIRMQETTIERLRAEKDRAEKELQSQGYETGRIRSELNSWIKLYNELHTEFKLLKRQYNR